MQMVQNTGKKNIKKVHFFSLTLFSLLDTRSEQETSICFVYTHLKEKMSRQQD
jgi:hypothetical protein